MIPIIRTNFADVNSTLKARMRIAAPVEQVRWQGRDVSKDPAARSYELQNVEVSVPLQGIEELQHWRDDIQPNLPWCDDHFLERVGGEPLNPGKEWANWPWGKSAAKFRDANEIFNHTYMERLWPKWARLTDGGILPIGNAPRRYPAGREQEYRGIAHPYGDLADLVDLLVREPSTRQAYIPLFFPEDTGWADGGRKVCTLGYHVLVRDGKASIWYPLRSCDFIRHFRDDCYLAVRLLLWIIDRCRAQSPEWQKIVPGEYTMHMTSLHVFENDKRELG